MSSLAALPALSFLLRADGSIAPNALGLRGVTALTHRLATHLVGRQVVAAEHIEAVYRPDPRLLARELVPGSVLAGFVRHRINLIPSPAHPRVLYLQGPRYAIPDREAGTWETWEPLPAGIDPGHGIQEGLEAEIVRLLGHHSALACRRLTLAPLDLVEAIAECLPAYQREAMQADGVRADWLAITGGALLGTDGVRHEAIRVAAGESATGRDWTLAVLDGALGEENLAACIAEAISDLPHPASVVLVTTGDSIVARRVVAEALAMAKCMRPAFAGEALAVRGDGRRPGLRALADKAAARLDRSLEALWREAPLTVERLEQRALVRQGYGARRRRARPRAAQHPFTPELAAGLACDKRAGGVIG